MWVASHWPCPKGTNWSWRPCRTSTGTEISPRTLRRLARAQPSYTFPQWNLRFCPPRGPNEGSTSSSRAARTTDLPIEATHPARRCLVRLGRLQRAQAGGAHPDHSCDRGGHRPRDPGHPGPPGTIALVSLPGEQMPDHAAHQLD
jgi:hypothetical protein